MSTLDYETKDEPSALLKLDVGAGTGTALFSRYCIEDADGDYTEPGFIPSGITVPMLIGHNWTEIPVAKGKIRSERDAAYYDFVVADTARGRELAEWLRFDARDGQAKSQFSYGFKIKPGGSSRQLIQGKRLRVLHGTPEGAGCEVFEVSYCLKGAGVGTQLVSMKGLERDRWERRLAELTALQQAHEQAAQSAAQATYERWQRLSAQINAQQRR